MNIIDVQDQLKDFSEQQLIREMQKCHPAPLLDFLFSARSSVESACAMTSPSGKRHNRRRSHKRPCQPLASLTVALPVSEAMAPKSTMAQNAVGSNMAQAMRSGGLAQFGQELSQKCLAIL